MRVCVCVCVCVGTINSTGSVVAAASFLQGEEYIDIASIIKMMQNSMIGFVAIGVGYYWGVCVCVRVCVCMCACVCTFVCV